MTSQGHRQSRRWDRKTGSCPRSTHPSRKPKASPDLFDQIRPGPTLKSDLAFIRNQTQDAAARRATRRLPLGEPPLVVTTHAITSYSIGPSRSRGSPASSKTGLDHVVPRSHDPWRTEVNHGRQTQYKKASADDQGGSGPVFRFPSSRAETSSRRVRHSSASTERPGAANRQALIIWP
jgi:hypothetical protein